jgi:hypothetical protein
MIGDSQPFAAGAILEVFSCLREVGYVQDKTAVRVGHDLRVHDGGRTDGSSQYPCPGRTGSLNVLVAGFALR